MPPRFIWFVFALLLLVGCAAERSPPAGARRTVAKDPREVPPPARSGGLVHFDLVAEERVAELAPGTTYSFWTFNGTVPGPMLRAAEGDTVEITLTNALGNREPHNLDFHAAIGPGGGCEVTNVAPGESRTFRFKATHRGAFMYHCAGEEMPWEHVAHGMFGLIEVDPPEGLEPGFREFYLGQSEWYVIQAGSAQPSDDDDDDDAPAGAASDGAGYVFDAVAAQHEQPTWFSFNGHTRALVDSKLFGGAMALTQGERVRLFFVNGGPNKTASAHVVGQIFDQVYAGHPDDATRNEETVSVPPGSAQVLEFTASVPGSYDLIDHALFRVPRGAKATFEIVPKDANDPLACWPYELYDPPPPPRGSTAGHM